MDVLSEAVDSLALIFQDINYNSENVEDPDKIYTSNFVVSLIGKLIQLLSPELPLNVRLPSFDCLTNLLVACPPELMVKIDVVIQCCLNATDDKESRIRQRVYAFFLGLCQVRKDILVAHSNTIFPKLAKCMWDTDKAARRACFMVFWEFLSIHDEPDSAQVVQLLIPYLNDIVPAFLANSLLTEEDKENLMDAIKQFIETNKVYEKGLESNNDEEAFQIEEEEDEYLDANGTYTLRKISLRCLIKIFEFLGNPAFELIKQPVGEMIVSNDPYKIEAAACVLGTVGNNCLDELKPSLGVFLSKLLEYAQSNNQFLQ